jgi:hypothetical protein
MESRVKIPNFRQFTPAEMTETMNLVLKEQMEKLKWKIYENQHENTVKT